MNRLILMLFLLFSIKAYNQTPNKINFQALVRNTDGSIVSNQSVVVRFNFLENSPQGTIVYSEIHSILTNNNGLINLLIGTGQPLVGDFTSINWEMGSIYNEFLVDINGGGNFISMSTQQLVSVPYAFVSQKSIEDSDNQTLSYSNNTIQISGGNSITLPANLDNSPTNEIQNLSVNGNVISISQANSITLPPNLDNDPTNELQNLTMSEDTIFISDGNYIVLPNFLILESPSGFQYELTVDDNGNFNTTLLCNPGVQQANAGQSNGLVQGTTHQLAANIPNQGETGQWSIISGNGGAFSNNSIHNPVFTGQQGQTYILRWTLTNSCGSSYNDVTISFSGVTLPSCQCQGQTLFVFPSNNGTSFWQNPPTLLGQPAQSVNDGEQNTNAIIAALGTAPFNAPQICYNLNQYGYTDWYLPSKDELDCMYQNRVALGNNFVSSHYWTSTEFSQTQAWVQSFSTGAQTTISKNYAFTGNGLNIRCIRKQ